MYPADASCCENLDAGPVRGPGRGGDRGCTVQLARDDDGEVAAAHLADAGRGRQVLDLGAIQPDHDLAADDADSRRLRAARADNLLQA